MHRLRINRLAQRDLEEIQDRGVVGFGPVATRAFMAGFDLIFARLAQYPLLGRDRPEFGRAVRGISHPPYKVLYRFEGDQVSILRIVHASLRSRLIDDTVQ